MKTIIFDLDGTLAESKQALDSSMVLCLSDLLKVCNVSIISGGSWEQFKKQIISQFPPETRFENLLLLPVTGSMVYGYKNNEWSLLFSDTLSPEEKKTIIEYLLDAEKTLDIKNEIVYGEKIEDRGTQITYSGLGQNAPIEAKKVWDPNQLKRKGMLDILTPLLPNFDIHIGGMTSVDITRKGVDKASGIRTIQKTLNASLSDMTFIGDALFKGGNDYPATTTGVKCIRVTSVEDTKMLIRKIIRKENSPFRKLLKKIF